MDVHVFCIRMSHGSRVHPDNWLAIQITPILRLFDKPEKDRPLSPMLAGSVTSRSLALSFKFFSWYVICSHEIDAAAEGGSVLRIEELSVMGIG